MWACTPVINATRVFASVNHFSWIQACRVRLPSGRFVLSSFPSPATPGPRHLAAAPHVSQPKHTVLQDFPLRLPLGLLSWQRQQHQQPTATWRRVAAQFGTKEMKVPRPRRPDRKSKVQTTESVVPMEPNTTSSWRPWLGCSSSSSSTHMTVRRCSRTTSWRERTL